MRAIGLTLLLATSLDVMALAQTPFEPLTEEQVRALCRQLGPTNDRDTRLRALRMLNARSDNKGMEASLAALQKCVRDDPDADVRQQGVNVLAHVAHRLKQPCPLAVVEALLDKEEMVRWQSAACIPFFKRQFAPGCVDVLLRGIRDDHPHTRSTCVGVLGWAGGNDKRALPAIDKARQDKVLDVRVMAHWAHFRVEDKLSVIVPYLIRMREDPEAMQSVDVKDEEARKEERTQLNLFILGGAMNIGDWSGSRPDELANLLLKLIEDEAPLMRRGAVNTLAAAIHKSEPLPERSTFQDFLDDKPGSSLADRVSKYLDPKPVKLEKSAACFRLEKLGMEKTLRTLVEKDPDRGVRDAAANALKQWERLNQKKP